MAFGQGVGMVCRVTQGCQPIAPVRTVTASDHNVVLTLDGEPALDVLLSDLKISLDEPQGAMRRLRQTLVGLTAAGSVEGPIRPTSPRSPRPSSG